MRFRSNLIFFVSLLVCSGLMGCSLDMFSKEKKDSSFDGRMNYHPIAPECSGLKIMKSELDVQIFRSLVRCFNANGSIPEVAALVSDSSDRALSHSVELLNMTFQSLNTGERVGMAAVTPVDIQAFAHVLRPIVKSLPLMGEIQKSVSINLATWRRFFRGIERGLLSNDFVPAVNGLRGLVSLNSAVTREEVGPAPLPSPQLLLDEVARVECELSPGGQRHRANEIVQEFNEAVLGWERPNGKLPLAWDSNVLIPRLRALSDSLTSVTLRKHLYSWLSDLDAEAIAGWLFARAQDPHLVAVMDPESRKPRLRWMTTLDRFESVLVNADFTYLLSGNYGLSFIEKFAESWGDEPREKWPLEIQERFSGRKKPPTLRETYEDVVRTISRFESLGGQPTIPTCVASKLLESPWGSAPEALVSFQVKSKAFNLKQTISVIEENLPDSHSPNAGGMRLLRDLFWAVNSSVARVDRNPSRPAKNPIRFFQRLGELGVLRTMSRGLQAFETRGEVTALADVFFGLKPIVNEPAFDRIFMRAVNSSTSFETWIGAVYRNDTTDMPFRFSHFVWNILKAFAADRSLHVGPVLLRFIDQTLSSNILPEFLLADLIRSTGESENGDDHLVPIRPKDEETKRQLVKLERFVQTSVTEILGSLPLENIVELLNHDPMLRQRIRQLVGEIGNASSHDLDRLVPYMNLFLSEEKPALRRMFAGWCGKRGGDFIHETAGAPHESFLMIDGLLRSADSPGFKEFLEALLR